VDDACAWCGTPLDDAERRRGRLVCRRCGAATTHPWPSDAELEAAYGDWYRPEAGRFGTIGDALLRRSRGSLAARIDAVAPPGPILDVGAGDGTLLRALAERGRDALGLERSADAANPHMKAAEIDAVDGQFAGIVFWHSLEHLRTPRTALDAAANVLAPGGTLFVAAPNAGSLQAQTFGDDWFALDIPRHLVHLPAPTLIAGLEQDGWRVQRVSYVRGGQVLFGWVHGLVGRLPGRLDLYQSIRSAGARSHAVPPARRAAAVAAGVVLAPVAVAAAVTEIALRRGGTVYVEARRG
jgi:SAM-dependent methyltransferase